MSPKKAVKHTRGAQAEPGRARSTDRARSRGPSRDALPAAGRRGLRTKGKLPQTARTKTEEAMHDRLASLEPGSTRYRVLVCAIDFKRSWLDLAEHLTQAQRTGTFKEWGYRTFEAYAQHELFLRRETAIKLTRSFDFLESNEPGLLEGARQDERRAVPLPGFQALDVLAEARKNPQLSESDYQQIRDQVFGEDMTASQVKKMVRERAPEPLTQKQDDGSDRLRRCLQLAERLYGMLMEEGEVPERITQAVEETVGSLRRMLEE